MAAANPSGLQQDLLGRPHVHVVWSIWFALNSVKSNTWDLSLLRKHNFVPRPLFDCFTHSEYLDTLKVVSVATET